MKTIWHLVVLAGFFSAQLKGQILEAPHELVQIESGHQFLPDPETAYQSPEELPLGKFQFVNDSSFNSGTTCYWLQFTVYNPNVEDHNVILDFQNWSLVDFHYRTNGEYLLKKTGHLLPYKDRDYAEANKSYIHLQLAGKDTVNCMVRLESQYNNEMIPTSLGFSMAPEAIVGQENKESSRIIFFFLGIFSVIFIYNFFLAISTKMRSYWYYLPVVLFAFYHTAYNSGYLIPFFSGWKGFPVALTYFETVSSALFSIVVLLFASEFLKTADRYPRLHKFFRWTIMLFVATAIISFVSLEIGVLLTLLGSLLVVILVITAAIRSVRDDYPASRFFLIGFSAFMAGALITVLAVAGVIPMTRFTFNYALPLGTAIEVSLYSLALANLINVLRRENEKNQQKIIEQLEENQLLQTKVNRELEQKVQERTQQIIEQKDLISAQKDEISKEKEKSDQLLTNILPETVAEELKEHGKANPKFFESASVLFADFKEFTKISPEYSPDALVERLDFFFKAFDDIITRHNLEKIKTIGDAYMP